MSFCKILLTKKLYHLNDREFLLIQFFSKHLQHRRISHLMSQLRLHYPQYRLERHNF